MCGRQGGVAGLVVWRAGWGGVPTRQDGVAGLVGQGEGRGQWGRVGGVGGAGGLGGSQGGLVWADW